MLSIGLYMTHGFNSNYLFVEDVCCAVTHANLHVYDV